MTIHFAAREKLRIAVLDPVPAAAVTPVALPATTLQETSDNYRRGLFLSADRRLRIIVCRDGIQWIVQTRRPFTTKSPYPWSARGFCTSKLGIKRTLGKPRIAATPGLAEFIEALPDRFVREATGA